MTLTFELDVGILKMTQCTKHLGQKSFSSNVFVQTGRETHRNTEIHKHWNDCSVWTTKVVSRYGTLITNNRAKHNCGLWHHAHFSCETGFVVVAMTAYRALETDTTVR